MSALRAPFSPPPTEKTNRCKHMIYMEINGKYEPIGQVVEAEIEGEIATPEMSGEVTIECSDFVAVIEKVAWDVESNNSRKMRGLGTRRGLDNALYRIRRELWQVKQRQ